jgi:hypothetical protein
MFILFMNNSYRLSYTYAVNVEQVSEVDGRFVHVHTQVPAHKLVTGIKG